MRTPIIKAKVSVASDKRQLYENTVIDVDVSGLEIVPYNTPTGEKVKFVGTIEIHTIHGVKSISGEHGGSDYYEEYGFILYDTTQESEDIKKYLTDLNAEFEIYPRSEEVELWDSGLVYWMEFDDVLEAINGRYSLDKLIKIYGDDPLSACCGAPVYDNGQLDDSISICSDCKRYV